MIITRRKPTIAPASQTIAVTEEVIGGHRAATLRTIRFTGRGAQPVTKNSAISREAAASVARELVDAQLKLISEAERQIDAAQEMLTTASREVERLLRSANLSSHCNGVHIAEIVEQFTRQSRTIDPKKFKNRVGDSVFWASIKVSMEAAESHLTEKEINSIADTIPSRSTGYVLKLKRVPVKKRGK